MRYMDPALTGKFFYSHILRHILRKSAVVLSLDNKLKRIYSIYIQYSPKVMHVQKVA